MAVKRYALPGWVYIVLAATMWSTSGFFTRAIAAPPLVVVVLRAAFAGICLAPFIRPKQIHWDKKLVLLIISYAFTSSTYIFAMQFTSAANTVALHYTAPLWVYLWTICLVRHTSWRQILPMAIILAGVIICLLEPSSGANMMGNWVALASGAGFAWLTVCIARMGGKNSLGIISLCNLLTVPILLPLVALWPGSSLALFAQLTPKQWLLGLCFGAFQLGFSYGAYFIGLRTVKPQKATILSLMELVLTPVWVFLFMGERPSLYGLICWLLIIAGLLSEALLKPQWDDANKPASLRSTS